MLRCWRVLLRCCGLGCCSMRHLPCRHVVYRGQHHLHKLRHDSWRLQQPYSHAHMSIWMAGNSESDGVMGARK